MAGIGEIVALAKGLGGSGGGGSSGGGVLVVHTTIEGTTATCDKTCKEMFDAMSEGGVVIDMSAFGEIFSVVEARQGENGSYTFEAGSTPLEFVGDNDNHYPYFILNG